MRYSYTVIALFGDRGTADEWVAWMRDDHAEKVLAAGALDVEVVQLDGEPGEIVYEARYHFTDEAAFRRYEAEEAPRLRQEGRTRFPPAMNVMFKRTRGNVLLSRAR